MKPPHVHYKKPVGILKKAKKKGGRILFKNNEILAKMGGGFLFF